MSMLARWREWRDRRAEEQAVVEEMQFHIEQETLHNLERGMSPQVARREAMKAFGGVERFAEAARDGRTGTKLSEFRISWLDWKLGGRMLLKYPGLSIIGGITLACAIGMGAGWFEMSMMMVYPDLPFEDGDRIVRLENWDAEASALEPRSLHDFMMWREQLQSVEQLGAARTLERNLIVDGDSRPAQVAEITPSAFAMTRVTPLLGRTLVEEDALPGAVPVVVIGQRMWQQRFGSEADVIGREVQLGRTRATIVGVMPEGFAFPRTQELWMPMQLEYVAPRDGAPIQIFGRLRDGATLESAQAELTAAGARMAASNPATHAHLRPRVLAFAAPSGPGAIRELLLLNTFGWILLAAAAANVATLMFARTAMRESEIVVRSALGASRIRVMGQLFTESLVLTTVAAVVGLTGAVLVISYVFQLQEVQRGVPFWFDTDLEPITILYTAILAVAGAAIVGLLPAMRATGVHVSAGLTRMASGGTSMRFGGVWSVIIVLQVAFSVICLPFAIGATAEALRQQQLRAQFPADAYLTFRPQLEDATAVAHNTAVIDELMRSLAREPEVVRVSVAGTLPGISHPLRRIEMQRGIEAPVLVAGNTDGNLVRMAPVGEGYFEVFGQSIVVGRTFDAREAESGAGVVVINESMAKNIGGNPIGVRVREAGYDSEPGPWKEVIGVVKDLGLTPTAAGEADYMYVPVAAGAATFVAVRVNGDAATFAPELQRIAVGVEPELRLYDVMTLREVIRRADLPIYQVTLMGIGVVLLAIILSAACLYALMSVAVARRTREIGIRVAIGATPREVLRSLFARTAVQVGSGIVIGNVLMLALMWQMVDNVRASAIVPPMIVGSLVMALVGFAACYVPGRRALNVQPTQALKEAR